MPKGHEYDGDTIAIWRQDELSVMPGIGVPFMSYEARRAYDSYWGLEALTVVAGKVGYARSTRYGNWGSLYNCFLSGAHKTAVRGNFTFECWFKSGTFTNFGPVYPGSDYLPRTLFAIGSYGRWYADDPVFRGSCSFLVDVLKVGTGLPKLYFGWTTNADTLEITRTQVSAFTPVEETWYHLAVVCTDAGATRSVEVFVNGSSVQTFTGLTKPAVDSNGYVLFGNESATQQRFTWNGEIDDLRISSKARSSGEVTSSYNRGGLSASDHEAFAFLTGGATLAGAGTVPWGHQPGANALALWRLNEAAVTDNAVDELNLYPLTQFNSPAVTNPGAIRTARGFNGTTQYFSGAGNSTAVSALLGNWTVEAWVKPTSLPAGGSTILAYAPPSGTGEANNTLLRFRILTTGKLEVYWQHGAGVGDTATQVAGGTVPTGAWTHVAATKTLNAGTYDVRFYIGGVLVDTITGLTAPTGGTLSQWYMGQEKGTSPTMRFPGSIDDVYVDASARSGTDIANDATGNPPKPAWTVDPDWIVSSVVQSATNKILVTFNRFYIWYSDLADPGNYSIPGLVVTAVSVPDLVSLNRVELTVVGLSSSMTYTLTASNLRRGIYTYPPTGVYQIGSPGNIYGFGTAGAASSWSAPFVFNLSQQAYVPREFDAAMFGFMAASPTAPIVDNHSPTPGTAITRDTTISFDVTDQPLGRFRRIIVLANFPDLGQYEVIHDGDAFATAYATYSSRLAITRGYHYSVRRAGGWLSSPTFVAIAIDTEGAENP